MKQIILVTLIIASFALPAAAGDGMINVASSFTVSESAERMVKILNKKGMTIFKRIKHSQSADRVGVKLRPTELIIFGNPKVGSPLMACQQSIAIDLPQKALIWEDEKGKVWISYNDPRYLAARHHLAGCEKVINKIGKALAGITKAAATR